MMPDYDQRSMEENRLVTLKRMIMGILPLRLNLCLQCDECYNAPKLVEVRGWIRHNSGIVCDIDRLRELISDVKVDYGVCGDE